MTGEHIAARKTGGAVIDECHKKVIAQGDSHKIVVDTSIIWH